MLIFQWGRLLLRGAFCECGGSFSEGPTTPPLSVHVEAGEDAAQDTPRGDGVEESGEVTEVGADASGDESRRVIGTDGANDVADESSRAV